MKNGFKVKSLGLNYGVFLENHLCISPENIEQNMENRMTQKERMKSARKMTLYSTSQSTLPGNLNKLDSIKRKNFCSSKDTVKRLER